MQALLDTLLIDMNPEALTATFNTAALLVVEMCSGETIQEFLLFILGWVGISIHLLCFLVR